MGKAGNAPEPEMTPFTIKSFIYDGVPLDLAGKRDAEDCWIERVCVAGTQHDIFDMVEEGVIDRLCQLADAHLSDEAKRFNAEARADLAKQIADEQIADESDKGLHDRISRRVLDRVMRELPHWAPG